MRRRRSGGRGWIFFWKVRVDWVACSTTNFSGLGVVSCDFDFDFMFNMHQ